MAGLGLRAEATTRCGRAFAGRTLCIIFWQLARTARRIGHRSGPHYAAVEADPSFYREWLAPRLGNHFLKKRGSS